jgi:hypothetical protein
MAARPRGASERGWGSGMSMSWVAIVNSQY